MDSFHIILRKVRLRHNLTQQQMANTLGVSQASYNRWETQKQNISLEAYICLLLLFHEDSEFLEESAKYRHKIFLQQCNKQNISQDKFFKDILPALIKGLEQTNPIHKK